MAAGHTKGDVVVRVEPLAAEDTLEVLQVVYVHLNEYIDTENIIRERCGRAGRSESAACPITC